MTRTGQRLVRGQRHRPARGPQRALTVAVALVLVGAPVAPVGAAVPAGGAEKGRQPAAAGSPTGPAEGPAVQSASAVGFRPPVDGPFHVTRPFQPPLERWLPGHRGVDLAAEPGAVVRAAGPGTVGFAGEVAGTGVVTVVHVGGLRTTYQPVVPLVSAGDQVRAGDPLGVLVAGHAGCPVAACLHWGLRHGELYLDPLALLGLGRVRLLPRRADRSGVRRRRPVLPHRGCPAHRVHTDRPRPQTGRAARRRPGRPVRVAA